MSKEQIEMRSLIRLVFMVVFVSHLPIRLLRLECLSDGGPGDSAVYRDRGYLPFYVMSQRNCRTWALGQSLTFLMFVLHFSELEASRTAADAQAAKQAQLEKQLEAALLDKKRLQDLDSGKS